jgi:glucose/arabinose dehydrogenase
MMVVALALPAMPSAASAAVPSGFTDELVATVAAPTAFAFTPDGRMLITTQSGNLRVRTAAGALLPNPVFSLGTRVCTNSERGLLGIAVDPNFAANRFIYLYWTFNKTGLCNATAVNRVTRHVLGDDNSVTGETVLINNIHSPAGNHNAGDLEFGKDGLLYVSVGDGGCDYAGGGCGGANDAARDRHVMVGKILRITRDGAIPASNPHSTGPGTGRCNVNGSTIVGSWCQEIFATGLRNPFRFGFDPNATGTRFFINDVGQNVWEEIDLGAAGADYGWNIREGHCATGSTTSCTPVAGLTDPIHDYSHSGGCASITGGAFVPNGLWGTAHDGSYLFGDYVCGKIFKRTDAGVVTEFGTGLGNVVHMRFGPHGAGGQALYYSNYAGGGQIRRIFSSGPANRPPTASMTATPTSGPTPLTVSFNGSASSDPDGDPLTYEWSFGDGSPNETTTGPTTSHTYTTAGARTATLTVRDGRGGVSAPASVSLFPGNTAPNPVIQLPAATATWRIGQSYLLRGRATDAQDGTLPASSLSWTVVKHHASHTHPFLGPVSGNDIGFTAPAPEDLLAMSNTYLRISLTATDSGGLSKTVSRVFNPQKVKLTFATSPTGLQLTIGGRVYRAPSTITSWPTFSFVVNAPDQGGRTFVSWSDGGARSHTIVTPEAATTYTATYTP